MGKNLLALFFGPEKGRCFFFFFPHLSSFPTNSASQLDVFGHDCYSLCMNGTQVGVLEKTHQVSFTGFLQSHDGRALEAEIGLKVLSDFTDQTLERQLSDQQLR